MKLGAPPAILIAAWLVVILCALGFHPALREGAPLAGLGRHIAEDASQSTQAVESLGLVGSHTTFAFWALDLSLLYVAGWGLVLLCPRRVETPASIPVPLLIAAVVGQIAATFARDATVFYFLSSGAVTASLVFIRRSEPTPRPSVMRLILASALGLLVVLLASPLDTGLATLTGAPMLPEAWFPLAVEFGSRPAVGVALSVVVALSCGALGFTRSGWIALAPACALSFGPSNPAKGLAAALVVVLLGRIGAGPSWRAGFLVVLTGLFVGVALRY